MFVLSVICPGFSEQVPVKSQSSRSPQQDRYRGTKEAGRRQLGAQEEDTTLHLTGGKRNKGRNHGS